MWVFNSTESFTQMPLSPSLSVLKQTSFSLTRKSDVTVRMTAVLHAHRLTDDGMHLVLQTGSTPCM